MKIFALTTFTTACCFGLLSFTGGAIFTDNPTINDGDTIAKKKMIPAGNYNTTIGGCNNNSGGTMSKESFLNLLNSPLCGKDNKTNKTYAVASYEITYCWRELSEDSTGHSIIITDNVSEPVDGDAVPDKWKKNFVANLYKGDTIKFENIKIRNGAWKYNSKNKVVVVIGE